MAGTFGVAGRLIQLQKWLSGRRFTDWGCGIGCTSVSEERALLTSYFPVTELLFSWMVACGTVARGTGLFNFAGQMPSCGKKRFAATVRGISVPLGSLRKLDGMYFAVGSVTFDAIRIPSHSGSWNLPCRSTDRNGKVHRPPAREGQQASACPAAGAAELRAWATKRREDGGRHEPILAQGGTARLRLVALIDNRRRRAGRRTGSAPSSPFRAS
jgi:hypothetical protein